MPAALLGCCLGHTALKGSALTAAATGLIAKWESSKPRLLLKAAAQALQVDVAVAERAHPTPHSCIVVAADRLYTAMSYQAAAGTLVVSSAAIAAYEADAALSDAAGGGAAEAGAAGGGAAEADAGGTDTSSHVDHWYRCCGTLIQLANTSARMAGEQCVAIAVPSGG